MSGPALRLVDPPLHDAAADSRLAASWIGLRQHDPDRVWHREGDSLSARAWKAFANVGTAAALGRSLRLLTLGDGMELIPAWRSPDRSGTAADQALRDRAGRARIRAVLRDARQRRRQDAGCSLTTDELKVQILMGGLLSGGGWAVSVWDPARPGCGGWGSCWRVIDGGRIETPPSKRADPAWVNGMRLRAGRIPAQIAVRKRTALASARISWSDEDSDYEIIDWYDDAGEERVVHFAPFREQPGTLRGPGALAASLGLLHQSDETHLAHVGGKRQQANLPLLVPSEDPIAAQKAYQAMRDRGEVDDAVSVLFYLKGSEPVFPTISYNGTDFAAFDEVCARKISAATGLPWQVVLAQLTNANLASSQAALDQADRAIVALYQNPWIEQVERPMDRMILREARARGLLDGIDGDLDALCAGDYRRPRKADANRLRTRQASREFVAMGGSLTTAHEEQGTVYDDEIDQLADDIAKARERGIDLLALVRDMPVQGVAADQPPADQPADGQASQQQQQQDAP